MRAVMGKEFRELLVVALPMWIVAAIVAAAEIAGSWDHTEDMVGTAIIGGLVLGLAQGLLDQFRRDDAFLAHRPLSVDRLQLARTLAGLLVLAIALLAFFASLWITTWVEESQLARLRAHVGPDLLPDSDPLHYGWAAHALVVAVAIASWAVARFVVGVRPYALVVPACLVTPVAAWAVLSRLPTVASATAVAAVFAVLFLGLVHVREAGRRGVLPRVLLLALLALVAFEGALWIRSGLADVQHAMYPRYWLGPDGDVHAWDVAPRGGEDELAADRSVLRHWVPGGGDGAPSTSLLVQGSLRGEADSLAYEQLDDPRFIPPHRRARLLGTTWGETVASDLSRLQARRSDRQNVPWSEQPRWTFEDGRLLCRRGIQPRVLAWVGPSGFHEGTPTPDSSRFPEGASVLAHDPTQGLRLPAEGPWTVIADEDKSYYFLHVVKDEPSTSTEPVRLDVVQRAFAPYAGPLSGPPQVLPEGRRFWLLDRQHGLLAPRALEADEYHPRPPRWRRTMPEAGGLETWLLPQHPTKYGARLRYFGQDRSELAGEVRFAPVTTLEKLPARAMGLLAALRPPLLNTWAYASEGPSTRSEMHRWWWRDPFFSSSSYGGWLLVSLALGAVTALLAWRSARLRLPTRAAQARWVLAVFLLGPLGLLWMKLAIGRTAVLPVGDGKRAVNLERTPDNPAPWPEPEQTGAEVFVG